MTNITYEIYYHNNLIGTTTEYLNYKQKVTIEGKTYLVISIYKNVNPLPDQAFVISVDRYDSKNNKLNTGDIVELDGYFYKIGKLCDTLNKEYVEYLNLDGSPNKINYPSYCTKLTYEHYKDIKDKLTNTLDQLEKAWILVNCINPTNKVDLYEIDH